MRSVFIVFLLMAVVAITLAEPNTEHQLTGQFDQAEHGAIIFENAAALNEHREKRQLKDCGFRNGGFSCRF